MNQVFNILSHYIYETPAISPLFSLHIFNPIIQFWFGSDLISGWVHQQHRADLAQRKDLHLTSLRKQFTPSVTDQSDMSTLLVVALQKRKLEKCTTVEHF